MRTCRIMRVLYIPLEYLKSGDADAVQAIWQDMGETSCPGASTCSCTTKDANRLQNPQAANMKPERPLICVSSAAIRLKIRLWPSRQLFRPVLLLWKARWGSKSPARAVGLYMPNKIAGLPNQTRLLPAAIKRLLSISDSPPAPCCLNFWQTWDLVTAVNHEDDQSTFTDGQVHLFVENAKIKMRNPPHPMDHIAVNISMLY